MGKENKNELRTLGMGVLVVAIILILASQIELPGSSAWSPVPTGIDTISSTPWDDIQPILGSEFRITSDGGELPDIYGDNVVFVRDYKVFVKNIEGGQEFEVSKNPAYQSSPAIYQDKIVWSDTRNRTPIHSQDIYMYDMTTRIETRISGDLPGYDINTKPDIYGNKIIWSSHQNDVVKIYMYNIDTETTSIISSPEAVPGYISIYGDRIVWVDGRLAYPNHDIYMYDISTGIESLVCQKMKNQSVPNIYEDVVVWMESEYFVSYNIHSYNIARQEETQLTDMDFSVGVTDEPAIYKNRIIWWQADKQSPTTAVHSIYMHDLNQPVGINHKLVDLPVGGDVLDLEETLSIYDKTIVWADKRDVQYDGKINVFGFKLF